MADIVIAVQRPVSMGISETRTWVINRVAMRQPALTLTAPDGPSSEGLLLRVEFDGDAGEDDFIDLMTDMRLLGFQPEVITSEGWEPADHFAASPAQT